MDFEWYELSEEDRAKKPDIWAPHATPVMAGGLFAIRKDYFENLGYYDEGDSLFFPTNLIFLCKVPFEFNLYFTSQEWRFGVARI